MDIFSPLVALRAAAVNQRARHRLAAAAVLLIGTRLFKHMVPLDGIPPGAAWRKEMLYFQLMKAGRGAPVALLLFHLSRLYCIRAAALRRQTAVWIASPAAAASHEDPPCGSDHVAQCRTLKAGISRTGLR